MEKDEKYIVLAFNYTTAESDYTFCVSKSALKKTCKLCEENGYDIQFAGKILITENMTSTWKST